MTDAERQHLREHFLEPETRCDFFVDGNRKKLWKCMLDMLEILDRTCREHGLRYFLFYGSLLGAIRHKGFIPWDDDLDIVMPRPDFDRIQTILAKELQSPFFLQNADTDPEYASAFFKIRNSSTSAITPFWVDRHIIVNMGIFIDIHSIDGIPCWGFLQKSMSFFRGLLNQVLLAQSNRGIKMPAGKRGAVGKLLASALGMNQGTRMRALSRFVRAFPFGRTKLCGITPFFYDYSPSRHVFPTEWFDEIEETDFEYLRVPVPKLFDKFLTEEYGDWHKFVRGTAGGAHHDWMLFDTERDFKSVLIDKFGYKKNDFPPTPSQQ